MAKGKNVGVGGGANGGFNGGAAGGSGAGGGGGASDVRTLASNRTGFSLQGVGLIVAAGRDGGGGGTGEAQASAAPEVLRAAKRARSPCQRQV